MSHSCARTRFGVVALTLPLLLGFGRGVLAQERLRPIAVEQMTDAQKLAVAEFNASRRGDITGGVYMTMLRTPGPLSLWHHLSLHLNSFDCGSLPLEKTLPCINAPQKVDKNVLGDRLTQLAIVITLVERNVQGEQSHFRLAEHFGVSPAILKSVVAKRRPAQMGEDEAAVYDLLTEMLRNNSVSDATYSRALANLGEPGIVDILNAGAYYSMISMMQNVSRSPADLESPAPPELR